MRDTKGLKAMDNFNYLASVPEGETIVSMCVHQDDIYVVTDRHLYKLIADKRMEQLDEVHG